MPSDYIAEPTIALFGCQPWPPRPDGAPFHAPKQGHQDGGTCPVCKGLIGLGKLVSSPGEPVRYAIDPRDAKTTCVYCGASSPSVDRKIASARASYEAPSKSEAAERDAERELAGKHGGRQLSESVRRRIWKGCKGDGLSSPEEVANRARVGRAWLTQIGQEPDWTLILDRRGNVIGRSIETQSPPAGVPAA